MTGANLNLKSQHFMNLHLRNDTTSIYLFFRSTLANGRCSGDNNEEGKTQNQSLELLLTETSKMH